MIFIYPKLHHHPFRVYNEPIQRPAPSWLVSLIGRELHWYRKGQVFESRTSRNFLRPFIKTAKVAYIYNCDNYPSFTKNKFVIRDPRYLTEPPN